MEILLKEFEEIIIVYIVRKDKEIEKMKSDSDSIRK